MNRERLLILIGIVGSWAVADGMTLEEAWQRTLAVAPEETMGEAEVAAAEQRVAAAKKWANPVASLEVENVAGSGSFSGTERAETTFSVEQDLGWPGQRAAERDWRHSQLDASRQAVELRRGQLRAEVRRRFVEALYTRQRAVLAEKQAGAARASADAVEEQRKVGAVSGLEGSRAAVEVAMAEADQERWKRHSERAMEQLVFLWQGEGSVSLEGDLTIPAGVPDGEAWRQWIEASPSLEALRRQRAAAEAYHRRERAQTLPEVTVGLGHRWFAEEDLSAWTVGLRVAIPLTGRSGYERGAAFEASRRAKAEIARQERSLRSHSLTLVGELQAAVERTYKLKEGALPEARRAYNLVMEGYQIGRHELYAVLDAQRTLFEVEAYVEESMADYHRTLAGLESLLGGLPENRSTR